MNIRLIASTACVAMLSLSATITAHANLPNHTWVSGLGSDSNSGTIASPYATLQHAVDNTAAGGLISVADPGDFGPVVITDAITIDGGSQGATIQVVGENYTAITINSGSSDVVVIRNINLNGGLAYDYGIVYNSAALLIVENCTISGFAYFGIDDAASAGNLVVRHTSIDGGESPILIQPASGSASLRSVNISSATDYAVNLNNTAAKVEISDSVITQCVGGILNDVTGAVVSARNCVFSFDQTAIYCGTGATVRLISNEIVDCTTGISASGGGTVLSDGNNMKGGLVSGSEPPTGAMSKY